MARNFKNISLGMQLLPHDSTVLGNTGGDMEVLSSDGKLHYYNASQSSSSPMVTEAHTATLTNKSISGSDNTITNISASSLPGNIVYTSNTQTLTNKIIDSTSNTITNIVNANIGSSAGIVRTKLASTSANYVVINDNSGVMSQEATLAKSRGGSGQDNSSVIFPASGTLTTNDGVQTLTNKTIILDPGPAVVLAAGDGTLVTEAQLETRYGGTGIGSYAVGDMIYIDADGETFDRLGPGIDGKFLSISNRVPFWTNAPTGLAWNVQTFTSNGTWTSGLNTTYAFIFGHGGGGGGGGGFPSADSTNATGGMGGGGAASVCVPISITPSTAYTVIIGAGGTGGGSNANGFNGAVSSFGTLQFTGGVGGIGGLNTNNVLAYFFGRYFGIGAGVGGDGGWGGAAPNFPTQISGIAGNNSAFNTGGNAGSNSFAFSGGGGGGAGDGTGGAGGNAGGPVGSNGSNGSDGGGGGGGGAGSTAGGGGDGGKGKIIVYWLD